MFDIMGEWWWWLLLVALIGMIAVFIIMRNKRED